MHTWRYQVCVPLTSHSTADQLSAASRHNCKPCKASTTCWHVHRAARCTIPFQCDRVVYKTDTHSQEALLKYHTENASHASLACFTALHCTLPMVTRLSVSKAAQDTVHW